jgi:hypothetical protein
VPPVREDSLPHGAGARAAGSEWRKAIPAGILVGRGRSFERGVH